MTDAERRAEVAEIFKKLGLPRRKDESARAIKMFEDNPLYPTASMGSALLDATTTWDEKFPPFFPLTRVSPQDAPDPKPDLKIVYSSEDDSKESAV